ncbi:MAG: alpha-ketoacid dehydrogenase subunit beta, partial [Salinibacterium sp.]|nr:alpha-ketoacid dehydrogenase subunit beta [Salinibacterium sp.]
MAKTTETAADPGVTQPAKAAKPLTMAAALNTAMRDALTEDSNVVIFGEDVGPLGGVFRITDGLTRDFGEDRVWDSPLAESGIIGTAIGMA